MKVSKYTFTLEYEENYYVYNALSNALIELDAETVGKIELWQKQKEEISSEDLDKEVYEILDKNNIISNSDTDDFLKYKSIIFNMRRQRESMHLTLAPTMDCCFNCHYCFEKYKKPGVMAPAVMDSIIKYVSSVKDLQNLKITWFGGEPLMAVKQIEEFYDKLQSQNIEFKIDSNIITTAYHVDAEVVRILKKVGVSSMQITLDGLKGTHNKIKNFQGAGDVFETVIKNIEYLNDNYPELHIVIRVNLTKENAHEYIPLVDMMRKRFKGRNKINPAPAFVLDRGASACGEECASSFFGHKERSEYILSLYSKNYDSPYVRYPTKFFNECAIRNDMAISFDHEGYAYKCWEVIGNREYAIGKLNEKGHLAEFNQIVFNRQSFGADPLDDAKCRNCKFLPICNGGCPIQRIQNEFEEGKNNCCTYYKGYIEKFLRIHIMRKEREELA